MKIVAVALLAAVTAAVSAQTAPKKKVPLPWDVAESGIIYDYVPYYLVEAGDGSLKMPQGTVGVDGRKTYTILTSSEWTCTPASGEENAVVIVCVKNDRLKPVPEQKPTK